MSKIMDHRNESFNGKNAYFEDVASRSKAVNRSITTKVGLKDYTKDEIEERCGEVVEYNYNKRYSFEEFKAMPERNKREYIAHLQQKYVGLRLVDIEKLFDISTASVYKWVGSLKLKWPKGGERFMCAGRIKFYEEMIGVEEPVAEEVDISEVEANEIPKFEEPENVKAYLLVEQLIINCDVENVQEFISRAGFEGRVRVTVTAIN